ncbi:MAG: class I SAM-dependent methyltransferase [Candidatus Kariarchaeaceae archaeon]
MSFRSLRPFEVIGSIVVLQRKDDETTDQLLIRANELLNLKNVKTAVVQSSKVEGVERRRSLEILAGKETLSTTHKAFGLSFSLNLGEVFYSTKLSFEHYRISKIITSKERILNLFCGVGGFTIFSAKAEPSVKVDSIDINPEAIKWAEINSEKNGVADQCSFYEGDALTIPSEIFTTETFDRIILPLPLLADQALSITLPLLKKEGWLHYQSSIRLPPNEDYIKAAMKQFENTWQKAHFPSGWIYDLVFSRIIRSFGPRINHIALDFKIKKN